MYVSMWVRIYLWRLMEKMKHKKITIGALTAMSIATPAIALVVTHNTNNNLIKQSANKSIYIDENTKITTEYQINSNGFVKMAMDLMPTLNNIKYTPEQAKLFYDKNPIKANFIIQQVNEMIVQRSFWSSIGNFFSGIGHAIATGATAIADGIVRIGTGGIYNIDNIVNQEAHATANSFSRMVNDMKNVDWEQFGINFVDILIHSLKEIETFFTGQSPLTDLAVNQIIQKYIIPEINKRIVTVVQNELRTNETIWRIINLVKGYGLDITKAIRVQVAKQGDNFVKILEPDNPLGVKGLPIFASGRYLFSVNFDWNSFTEIKDQNIINQLNDMTKNVKVGFALTLLHEN